jgi:phosphoserine phosphatase
MIVAFDLEGTLVDAELFPALGELMGNREAMMDATEKAMSGEMDFRDSLEARLRLIKGSSIDSVSSVAGRLPLQRGARATVKTLKRLGCVPAIITGGFDVLAHRAAHELGITYVTCNRFRVENGCVTGVMEPVVTAEAKSMRLKALAGWLGEDPSRCVTVGDGANDVDMMDAAGLSIAFNGRPMVKAHADVSIDSTDLRDVLPHIMTYIKDNNHGEKKGRPSCEKTVNAHTHGRGKPPGDTETGLNPGLDP